MLIKVKNKDTLKFDDFIFKCCIGQNGIKTDKIEGDKCTPRGIYNIGHLYYREDRIKKPQTLLKIRKIKKNMGWCDDPKSKFYNREIKITKSIKHEKIFRKDNIYDSFIVVLFNYKKKIPGKGSAIFIHITNNYKPTAGCIALKKKDFFILAKLINKKTKLKIY